MRDRLFVPVLAAGIALGSYASAQWGSLVTPEGLVGPEGRSGQPAPAPYHDVRLEGDQPAGFVLEALDRARGGRLLAARERAVARLAEAIPLLRVDDHEFFGTPHWIGSPVALLTPPREDEGWTADSVVRDFVAARPELFEIPAAELARAHRSREFTTRHNGVVHLTYQQRIDGIDLFGAELRASVSARGELINVSSTMLPRPDADFAVSTRVLDALDALRRAAADVGIGMTEAPRALSAGEGPSEKTVWSSTRDFRADEALTTELVYFPRSRGDIRTAWAVLVPEIGIGNTYETIVDATTGEILRRWNRLHFLGGTQDIHFRIFTEDSPAPGSPGTATATSTQFATVSRSLVTVTGASVQPWSPNGWIDDGASETLGNNCDAHTDHDANNVADLPRPSGGATRTFDFPLDLASGPLTSTAAAVTNLFYLTNRYHDRLYEFGFDEPAGNFQQSNFALGGVGGDRVQAQAQDGATTGNPAFTNNANFGTGGDGSVGRCQMFVWSGPTPDRDGSFESDVVYHELSHGLSLRLSGLTLNGEQSGGMGEGWGDYFGLSLNTQPTDPPDANYPMGPYATFLLGGQQANYFWGIRRLPYTTDMGVNPLTYADADPNQIFVGAPTSPIIPTTADTVHNLGEIWCLALWECRANMIAAQGFGANDTLMRLVVDGMKLMPSNPNMLQSRDAILQADLVGNGAVNHSALWSGFAKRGMGVSATSPSGTTTTGIVEAFDTPSLLDFTYPLGIVEQIQPFGATILRVDVAGLGGAVPTPGTGTLTWRVDGGSLMSLPMTSIGTNSYEVALPIADCFAVVEYFVSADSSLGTFRDPALGSFHRALVFESTAVALEDDFQADLGWTVASTASDGAWQRGVPQDNGRGDPPFDFDGSGSCFLTDNDPSTSNSDVDNGTTTLTSPAMDLADGSIVSWAYWLNDIASGALNGNDSLDVEFATDAGGTNWQALRSYASASAVWRTDQVVVGVDLPSSPTLRLRFVAKDLDTQNVVEAGVDAFVAELVECEGLGLAYCFGDGTGTSCPCGNNEVPGSGSGCLNSSGVGCVLFAAGAPSLAADTLRFDVSGGTPSSFAILVSGNNMQNGGLGTVAFDGLRCTGGGLLRHGTRALNTFGQNNVSWGPPGGPAGGLLAQGGFTVGQTRNFQAFYRENDTLVCLSGQNTSNAFSITVRP